MNTGLSLNDILLLLDNSYDQGYDPYNHYVLEQSNSDD